MYNNTEKKVGEMIMRVVLQRVKHASCKVDDQITGAIEQGYLLLVGITHEDTVEIVEKMVSKIINLRIFEDENGKMNLSLADVQGSILSISQFTLYADCRKGRRPGFEMAAKPVLAKPLYEKFNQLIEEADIHVETGIFGADMKIDLLNDGPVTLILDSNEIIK